jgi:DNA-directed RNA polymerase alpha subunit
MIRELELQRPAARLFLPGRVQNALLGHGIRTVGRLITRSEEDLLTEVRAWGLIRDGDRESSGG